MISSPISRYLESQGTRGLWKMSGNERRDFRGAVVIPALAERNSLFLTLDSLARNPRELLSQFLIVIVVNNRSDANPADKIDNEETLDRISKGEGISPNLQIGWVDAASPGLELPPKDGGVGLARKIGFDLALSQLDFDNSPPLLVSLDADTFVRPDYLPAIRQHFREATEGGAVIPFCHQKGEHPKQEAAIQRYELFLRTYVLGLEQAGSPYAFHTVGSTMACRADAYVRMGGMNHRKAGEDFYFLQHLAKTAGVRKLKGTMVFPSPRISHRVPFGTGRSISRLLADEKGAVLFYRPECFQILKEWLALVSQNLSSDGNDIFLKGEALSEYLGSFLTQINFPLTWQKLKRNFPAPPLRLRGFHHWFDGLKTLKLIHSLSAGPYPRTEPDFVVLEFLRWAGLNPLEGTEKQLALLRGLQIGESL
jgi:glycosyltransferase involved in cell wall biosynthesis